MVDAMASGVPPPHAFSWALELREVLSPVYKAESDRVQAFNAVMSKYMPTLGYHKYPNSWEVDGWHSMDRESEEREGEERESEGMGKGKDKEGEVKDEGKGSSKSRSGTVWVASALPGALYECQLEIAHGGSEPHWQLSQYYVETTVAEAEKSPGKQCPLLLGAYYGECL
jgi:hypothetical protein